VTAVESFRDRAYAAGNLKSDSRQRVAHLRSRRSKMTSFTCPTTSRPRSSSTSVARCTTTTRAPTRFTTTRTRTRTRFTAAISGVSPPHSRLAGSPTACTWSTTATTVIPIMAVATGTAGGTAGRRCTCTTTTTAVHVIRRTTTGTPGATTGAPATNRAGA
jgi:mucin-2